MMDTKTEMLIARLCRTPGDVHLGHPVYLCAHPRRRGWGCYCSSVVVRVMSVNGLLHLPNDLVPLRQELLGFVRCEFES